VGEVGAGARDRRRRPQVVHEQRGHQGVRRRRLEHLDAGLAVWRYSADSAAWIFGDSLGDPTADEIWAASKERPAGVTRTEVSDMFSRNKKRREIDRALSVLEDAGRLRRDTRQAVRGRHAEVWIPVTAHAV